MKRDVEIDIQNIKYLGAKNIAFKDSKGTEWMWVMRPQGMQGGPFYIDPISLLKVRSSELDKAAEKAKIFKILQLKANRGYLQGTIHKIAVENEDEECWKGRPVSNPTLHLCTFPKKIWKLYQ